MPASIAASLQYRSPQGAYRPHGGLLQRSKNIPPTVLHHSGRYRVRTPVMADTENILWVAQRAA